MDAVAAAIRVGGGGARERASASARESLADRVEKAVGITMTEKEKDAIERERREAAMYWPVSLNTKLKPKGSDVSDDRRTFTSSGGYRTCVASHGVKNAGGYYYEITVAALGSTGHARVGWKSKSGERNAPVGYDAYGYGYKDIGGEKVHRAVTSAYGEAFGQGDVIGCYIYVDADVVKSRDRKAMTSATSEAAAENASFVAFSRNGKFQGKAFTNLNASDGAYFPAGALYTMPNDEPAKLVFNFGPTFEYPPDAAAWGVQAPLPMSHFDPPRPPPAPELESGPEIKTEPETESVKPVTSIALDEFALPSSKRVV